MWNSGWFFNHNKIIMVFILFSHKIVSRPLHILCVELSDCIVLYFINIVSQHLSKLVITYVSSHVSYSFL